MMTRFCATSFSWLIIGIGFILALKTRAQTYSATYLPSNVPETTEEGQTGTNRCGTTANQTSACQNAYLNAVDDFCLWGPPEPNGIVGNDERIVVAWCMRSGTGSRLIPDGTIQGAHFVHTPDFIQITGVGDLTRINIAAGDAGGELDPHGADGNGNPIGGLVFSTAFGQLQQVHEWTQFISDSQFCFRACTGSRATQFCEHIYDVMGCNWNMPANYGPGVFENCRGDSGEPMGVYGSSKFFQGQPVTPPAHPIPASSQCSPLSSIANGFVISGTVIASSTASVPASITSPSASLSPSMLSTSALLPSSVVTVTSAVSSSSISRPSLSELSASSISLPSGSTSAAAAAQTGSNAALPAIPRASAAFRWATLATASTVFGATIFVFV